jgi:RimJ/RimL family protein N-acetyltransferase
LIGEKNLWGRGYGTDAIKALTRFGFEEEGADMIFGLVEDYNPRSLRAFAKAGYVEDQRVEEPPGRKARWACDLVLGREDFHRGREKPLRNLSPQVSPGRTEPRER